MAERRFLRTTLGVYYASSGVLAIPTSAHASLAGFLWLINPVGSPVTILVRRVEFKYMASALAAANTRLTLERMTFTGGPATALVTALQRHSAEPAPSGRVLSDTTGITPATVGSNAPLYTSWVPSVITAAGVLVAAEDEWIPRDEDDYIRLLPGEGIVVRQPDAGIATDPRKAIVMFEWEEFQGL